MLKDIRETPVIQTLKKAVGAKYLVKAFSPKKKQGASDTPDTFSPLQAPLARANPHPAVDMPRAMVSSVSSGPKSDFCPFRAIVEQESPGARGLVPPPMPEVLAARRAPAPRARVAGAVPGFSPLGDAARAQAPAGARAARGAQARAERNPWVRMRQAAQQGSPAVPTVPVDPAAFAVPVVKAQHAQNAVRDTANHVRLLHGRNAAAQGGFGRFYRAITPSGQLRGVKQVNTSGVQEHGARGLQPSSPDRLLEEVNHMKRLGMKVYAIHDTSREMFVETELYAGDLTQAFNQMPRSMRATAARSALAQQAQQLDSFHKAGYMHRDVKSENTLFTESGTVQVADPGLAKQLDVKEKSSCTGTQAFMAPEVLNTFFTGSAYYDAKVDTWSLGTVACQSLVSADWPLLDAADPGSARRKQWALIDFRAAVMDSGEVDLKAVAERKDDGGWGAYFHQMALADKGMCKFVLGRMFDPNPGTRATMQEVIAASKKLSTVAKLASTVKPKTAEKAFQIAARADKNYRSEVDRLQIQRLTHIAFNTDATPQQK